VKLIHPTILPIHQNFQLDNATYGINVVTAASLVAEIGSIARFPNAGKLANFPGIAPVLFGSGDNHKHYKCKQGNRA
jgi:hypothetical protein